VEYSRIRIEGSRTGNIDNVAIRTVREPSTLPLIGIAIVMLTYRRLSKAL